MGNACSTVEDEPIDEVIVVPADSQQASSEYASVDFTQPFRDAEFAQGYYDITRAQGSEFMPYSVFRHTMQKMYAYLRAADVDTTFHFIQPCIVRSRHLAGVHIPQVRTTYHSKGQPPGCLPSSSTSRAAGSDGESQLEEQISLAEFLKFGYLFMKFHEVLADPRVMLFLWAEPYFNSYASLGRLHNALSFAYSLESREIRAVLQDVLTVGSYVCFSQWGDISAALDTLGRESPTGLYEDQAPRAKSLARAYSEEIQRTADASQRAEAADLHDREAGKHPDSSREPGPDASQGVPAGIINISRVKDFATLGGSKAPTRFADRDGLTMPSSADGARALSHTKGSERHPTEAVIVMSDSIFTDPAQSHPALAGPARRSTLAIKAK